jgi:hypothetical protein
LANVLNGNTFFVDTASSAGTTTSYLAKKDLLLEAWILSANSNGTIVIADLKYTNGSYSAGDAKLHLHCAAHDTNSMYLNGFPIRFPNGIWITSIDAGVDATLIIKDRG